VTIFQNALGLWTLHDGAAYQYFDSEMEARMAEALQNIGEEPAEITIARTVTQDLLPQLRAALLALTALKMAWHANEIPALIEAAQEAAAELLAATPENPASVTEADTLIAGLPFQAWQAWGAVLTSLEQWLNTPLDGVGATPMAILSKKYVRKA
jgi:hypothetical protein